MIWDDLLWAMPVMGITWLLWSAWKVAKAALSLDDAELHSVKAAQDWKPTEAQWAVARLRRARTERYRAEHAQWDQLFNPEGHSSHADKCAHCYGPRDRMRRYYTG